MRNGAQMNSHDILSLELELYKQLADLAAKQISFLEQERINSFMSVWEQREKIQSKISALEEKRMENMADLELLGKIEKIQQGLLKADNKMKEIVERKKAFFQTELKKLRLGQKALRGYGPKRPAGSRFITREG